MDQPSAFPREYFVFEFPLSDRAWHRFAVRSVLPRDLEGGLDDVPRRLRELADRMKAEPEKPTEPDAHPAAEALLALRTINRALRHVASRYFLQENPESLQRSRDWIGGRLGTEAVGGLYQAFVELFPPLAVELARISPRSFLDDGETGAGRDRATIEMLLLFLNRTNPAAEEASSLFDDTELRRRALFIPFVTSLEEFVDGNEPAAAGSKSLFHLLREPMLASPHSLTGQLEYMHANWGHLLPEELLGSLQQALDILNEFDAFRTGAAGPPPVLEFGRGEGGGGAWGDGSDEPEAFSRDADWMANVVLIAKSVYVWLDQLSRSYGRPIRLLSDVPDEELATLAGRGINGLWLIGLWERSTASRKIKQYMGNAEAAASAYALREYSIAADLGGHDAWRNLHDRALAHGVRLASDMVPNHMGIDSRWVVEHPDYFLQADNPPYPAYRFTGGDLCDVPGVAIRIEDGYWDRRDAAVVFQRVDENTGQARYIYHGNDGTSMPWNDTAQLNFLVPEVREAVIRVILDVARMFPIIRFDAAMTLARKHYQRLWFPAPGDAGAIPSRAEHGMTKPDFEQVFPAEFWREVVDRVGAEVPDTLLLAEAFWLMEGFFVRTLGMHRVYNSAFMNMLKMEENAKYRQTIRNVLEFSPQILQRFVNFMNNPDEETAVEQFGRGDKYFGCMVLLATMPGLPMIGHGQIEGFGEKYGMEYRRAYWDERPDTDLVRRHEWEIFPLLRRRHLFSSVHNFRLYDFHTGSGAVDENVFAYSNGAGGQRVLVIYNNAYQSTGGALHYSAPYQTGPAGGSQSSSQPLAEALDIDPAGGDWVLYRDLISRREFLRPMDEVRERGFPVDLHGYEYRVLTDFHCVRDQSGAWAELAARLGGGGSEDAHADHRRIELEPLLEQLASLAEAESAAPATERSAAAAPAAKTPRLGPATTRELAALRKELDKGVYGEILAVRDLLVRLPEQIAECVSAGEMPLEIDARDEDLLAEVLAERLLARPPARDLALARFLVEHATAVAALGRGKTDWLAAALESPAGARVAGVNEHQGIRWVVREELDRLLKSMAAAWLAANGDKSPAPLLDGIALALDAAEKAEYRVDELLLLIGR